MCAVQGLLSFLSAPLIGALSDIWGRKPFLLLTVTFTCVPIPLMKFSPWSVAYTCYLQTVYYVNIIDDSEPLNLAKLNQPFQFFLSLFTAHQL